MHLFSFSFSFNCFILQIGSEGQLEFLNRIYAAVRAVALAVSMRGTSVLLLVLFVTAKLSCLVSETENLSAGKI